MRSKILAIAATSLFCGLSASATVPLGYGSVSSSGLSYFGGPTGPVAVTNATTTWAPVDNSGSPISARINGSGQRVATPVSAQVTSGAFSLVVADTALTNPSNICYLVTVTDNLTGNAELNKGFTCLQPAGSGTAVTGSNSWCTAAIGSVGGSCDFDLYVPNIPDVALTSIVTGPAGPACTGSAGVCTMTLPIVLPANPTSNLQAAPKQYVDAVTLAVPGPVFNVVKYGAVGDCSPSGSTATSSVLVSGGACTNNQAAIQAAINAAYPVGGTVYLPINTAGTPTVYYVGGPLNPKGVSIMGPPGAGMRDPSGYWGHVDIRGAAGQDVFATGDPTTSGWIYPFVSFVWQDFGIILDDTVDVASSHPHRRPGKTCNDVTVTNASAAISSNMCEFLAGDVGQNVTVSDGTTTLTTTIAAIDPGTVTTGYGAVRATLAATWTGATTGSTPARIYVSVLNMPVTTTVGNCALAYDDTNSLHSYGGINAATFRNMIVSSLSGLLQNDSCGFFLQGISGSPYGVTWDTDTIRTDWGFLVVPADTAPTTGANNQAMGDLNSIRNVVMDTRIPWITYNGSWNKWIGGQIDSAQYGPQILMENLGAETGAGSWTVSSVEWEQQGASGPGFGWRVSGTDHKFDSINLASLVTGTPAQWDAASSTCERCSELAVLNLGGALNTIDLSDGGDKGSGFAAINDFGFGNFCRRGRAFNPLDGTEPALYQSCSAVNSRQHLAFAHTSDFVANGNELTPYANQGDLWIWPPDLQGAMGTGRVMNPIITDATSESGSHLVVSVATLQYWEVLNNSLGIVVGQSNIGPNLPATMVNVCFRAKAESGSGAAIFYLLNATLATVLNQVTPVLTTTYGTYCFAQDLTSLTGTAIGFQVYTPNVQTDLAWISVHPFSDVTRTKAVQIGLTGTPMTATHGTAGQAQESDGTGASGNLTKYDANGNVTNGPAVAGAGAGVATGPTSGTVAGHLAKYADTAGTLADSGFNTPQTCATSSITPATTAGGTATGTCTISASATGHAGVVAATDGSVQGIVIPQVSVSGTTATVTLTTVIAGTPTAKTYNVTVF